MINAKKATTKYWGNKTPKPTAAQEFEQWQSLANAVIKQAVKDFRKLSQEILSVKTSQETKKDALVELIEIVEFFGSERFEAMSTVDGDKVLIILTEEILSGKKFA